MTDDRDVDGSPADEHRTDAPRADDFSADDPHADGDRPADRSTGDRPTDRSTDDRSESRTGEGPSDDRTEAPPGEEWGRVPIDLSAAQERADAGEPASGHQSDEDAEDDPYAPEASSTPVEPGNPSFENALFVALGALVMLVIMSRLFTVALG